MPEEPKYVPFHLYDFTELPDEMKNSGFEPGFYYNIPDGDEKAHQSEVFLQGPYETADLARHAALDFIAETLTSYVGDAA